MTCPACDFEKQYGTKMVPRPVPDLSIHQCGQMQCPMCGGYTVINGSPMGPFAVAGGEPCPLCTATGRVVARVGQQYSQPCHGLVSIPANNGDSWVSCALDNGHAGKCQPITARHQIQQSSPQGFTTYCGLQQAWCKLPEERRIHTGTSFQKQDCFLCQQALEAE